MINMGELFAHDRIHDVEMERVPMNDKELSSMLVQKDDLLFARQSLIWSGAGKCSIVMALNEPTTFESHIIRIRLDREKAETLFYYYYFRSPFSGMTSIITQGVQAGIRANDLKKLNVYLPSLGEQKKISSFLSRYDDLIENNRRRIQLLEESAQLLYREWFVHLRFPGHEHVKVVDGLPEGWEKSSVGELTEQIKSTVKPKDIDPVEPYIGLEHIPRRAITLGNWGQGADVTSGKYRFKEHDILFGKIRPYFHKVGFALTGGVASSDAIVVRAKRAEMQPLVLACMSSDQFVAVASKTVREGSKMPRADWSILQQYPVLIPNHTLLEEFNSFMDPILKQLKNLTFANKRLAEARDLLLPRLMNGEIAV
jgi:type I restriction enzyme S subunit